ncbi:hypothetical protein [Bowmanella denitrificans]|uniref:hypothetical protein n=1 Tax=Bowmanella denitrificans TaxID=366582 RepID=UPI000C9A2BBD|nr:hypothetical protein [Bowmanella denitrificans]
MDDAVNMINGQPPKRFSFWQALVTRWGWLSPSQKLYVLALVILPFHQGWMVALPTALALAMEFWPRFTTWWESLAGRALILLFYAAIANFAVAGAAGLVNDVTGVAAHNLSYTHNFAILLLFPTWAISISLILLLLFQMLLPLYLIAILLLKPFGEKGMRLLSRCRYPISTTLVRILLSTMVLVNLMDAVQHSSHFAEGQQITSTIMQKLTGKGTESAPKANQALLPSESTSSLSAESRTGQSSFGLHINNGGNLLSCSLAKCDYRNFTRVAVANFVYFFESDEYSRCQLDKGSKVVELNDYEILQITQQDDAALGYTFEVKKCISAAFGH